MIYKNISFTETNSLGEGGFQLHIYAESGKLVTILLVIYKQIIQLYLINILPSLIFNTGQNYTKVWPKCEEGDEFLNSQKTNCLISNISRVAHFWIQSVQAIANTIT